MMPQRRGATVKLPQKGQKTGAVVSRPSPATPAGKAVGMQRTYKKGGMVKKKGC